MNEVPTRRVITVSAPLIFGNLAYALRSGLVETLPSCAGKVVVF